MKHRYFLLFCILIVGLSATSTGCSTNEPVGPFNYSISLPASSELLSLAQHTQAALLVDGAERGRFTLTGGAQVSVPAEELLAQKQLVVRLAGACGNVDVSLEPAGGVEEERRLRNAPQYVKTTTKTISLHVNAPKEPHPHFLYIDNKDHPTETIVRVGDLEIRVPPREAAKQEFLTDTCASPPTVSVGGRNIGKLPNVTDKEHAILVDVVGGHCYRWNEIQYQAEGSAGAGGPSAPPQTFTNGPLHVVPLAGYLLTQPPPTLSALTRELTHSELQRIACPSSG